jgi:hypothetical protein
MPLPGNVGTGTVTGTFTDDDGTAAAGKVYFIPPVPYLLDPSADTIVVLYQHIVTLDANGDFTQVLVATDDTDLSPVDWTWQVRIELQGKPPRSFPIAVPAGSTRDLADIAPAPTSSSGTPAVRTTSWELFAEYTTPGTTAGIALPADTIEAEFVAVGSGSGGGSGRRGAAATLRGGGGGGGGGSMQRVRLRGAVLAETFTVVVPTGGAGGAAVTVDDTNGNPGAAGAASGIASVTAATTGLILNCYGSNTAAGGGTNAAGGVAAAGHPGEDVASPGGAGSTGAAAGAAGTNCAKGASGAGGGGGISAANAAMAGGNGGYVLARNTTALGGAATGAVGSAGTSPNAAVYRNGIGMGNGGGGGGANASGAGGAGGAGGYPGGGGGGGGASVNGSASGAGGAGANGYVAIWVLRDI